jgi:hypothetical protein
VRRPDAAEPRGISHNHSPDLSSTLAVVTRHCRSLLKGSTPRLSLKHRLDIVSHLPFPNEEFVIDAARAQEDLRVAFDEVVHDLVSPPDTITIRSVVEHCGKQPSLIVSAMGNYGPDDRSASSSELRWFSRASFCSSLSA